MENTPKQESLTLMLLTKIFACHQDEIPELVLQFFHLNKKHMHQLRSTLKQESLIDNEFMTSFISDISAYTVYMGDSEQLEGVIQFLEERKHSCNYHVLMNQCQARCQARLQLLLQSA